MDSLGLISLLSAVLLLLSMIVCSAKQLVEVHRLWTSKSHLLRAFRWYSLAIWLLVAGSIIFSPPQLVYLYMRYKGVDNPSLRNFAVLSSTIWRLVLSMLLIVIWFFKPKADE